MSRIFRQILAFQSKSLNCELVKKTGVPYIIRHSSYGPHFVEPIHQRKDLIALQQSDEAIKFKHLPIKAARSEQTCSDYFDPVLEKFINYVMREGKKELARGLVYKALETVKRIQVEKYNKEKDPEKKAELELNSLTIFHQAVENCKPVLTLTPVKRGGQTYQVPIPVGPRRAVFMSMNWLIEQGKAEPKTERFYVKLARELISASLHQGKVIKKKQDLHRQCEANRAYAHYRWS